MHDTPPLPGGHDLTTLSKADLEGHGIGAVAGVKSC